jgi:hypothetical protein
MTLGALTESHEQRYSTFDHTTSDDQWMEAFSATDNEPEAGCQQVNQLFKFGEEASYVETFRGQ